MLDLVKNILEVAKSVYQIATGTAAITRDRRDRLAVLLKEIGDTLDNASATLKRGETPHGACAALFQYSMAIDKALEGFVPPTRAAELGEMLRSSYRIEGLANDLAAAANKAENLAALDQASGTFLAAAQLVRAT